MIKETKESFTERWLKIRNIIAEKYLKGFLINNGWWEFFCKIGKNKIQDGLRGGFFDF